MWGRAMHIKTKLVCIHTYSHSVKKQTYLTQYNKLTFSNNIYIFCVLVRGGSSATHVSEQRHTLAKKAHRRSAICQALEESKQ